MGMSRRTDPNTLSNTAFNLTANNLITRSGFLGSSGFERSHLSRFESRPSANAASSTRAEGSFRNAQSNSKFPDAPRPSPSRPSSPFTATPAPFAFPPYSQGSRAIRDRGRPTWLPPKGAATMATTMRLDRHPAAALWEKHARANRSRPAGRSQEPELRRPGALHQLKIRMDKLLEPDVLDPRRSVPPHSHRNL